MIQKRIVLSLGLAALMLVSCDKSDAPNLMNMSYKGTGPNEFDILPNSVLAQPQDYSTLPDPTSGKGNLADLDPSKDVIKALGGVITKGKIDPKLINYTSRFGGDSTIRAILAKEDLEFRRKNKGLFMERLFDQNIYFKVYKKQSLDQYAELDRLRSLGVRTVSAPPKRID